MKALLIIPQRKKYSLLPAPDIGLAYIGGAALAAGCEVEILDAHKENIPPQELKNILKNKDFDLVGIKCLSIDIFKALEYCKSIKGYNPKIVTLLGGYHPTVLAQEVMKFNQVDYIIRGEGELGISSLIRKLKAHNGAIPGEEINKIPSLVYRDAAGAGRLRFNPVVFEENLDNLGFPAWHLFKLKEYPLLPGPGGRFLPVITSRGCPSNCAFCCSDSMHGLKVRLRTPGHVIEEIKWLVRDFNIQRISIFDDNFTFYKEHALAICDLFKKNKFNLKFDISQGIRIDKIDKGTLLALDEAGCDYIGLGVESGDQRTLDIVGKKLTVREIEEKINLIKKCTKLKLIGFFIIGFPHESAGEIAKTINFALRLKLDYAAFTIFTPFPGTALFEEMRKEGYFSLKDINWEDLLLDRPVFKHKNISLEELKALQRKAYIKFYFRLTKIPFFFRVIFREGSFRSYLRRFISILKNK